MRASLLALAGGALAVLVACSLTWSVITVPMLDDGGPVRTATLSGTDLAPLASASAWVALAGVLAVIATRSWGRVIVGGVVLTAGAVIVVSSASVGWQSSSNPLWTLAVAGGLIVGAAGISVLLRGRAWPGLGRRFEAPAGVAPGGATPVATRPRSPWDAIDSGDDPTSDGPPA